MYLFSITISHLNQNISNIFLIGKKILTNRIVVAPEEYESTT